MKAKINSITGWLKVQFAALRKLFSLRFKVSKRFLWRAAIVLVVVVLGVILAGFFWQTPEFRSAVQDTTGKLGNSVRGVRRRLTRRPINLLVMQEAVVADPDGTVVGIEGETIPAEATGNGRIA